MTIQPASIERLEARIAPAAVTINSALKTATWTDFDGDLVTLKYSTNAPTFNTTDKGKGLLVDEIALTSAANKLESFVLTVKTGPLGDGQVNIGHVGGGGVPLKSWSSPAATIAEFDCGDGITGIGSLTTGTLGALNYEAFGASSANGTSTISGASSMINVRGDLGATKLLIMNAPDVKSITFSGSLRGTDIAATGGTSGELALVASTVRSITIGGSVIGGDHPNDGKLSATNPVGSLTIKGDIRGGTAENAGQVVLAEAKSVKIGGDVIGGSASGAGFLSVGSVKALNLGGSIFGGTEAFSGNVTVGNANTVKIKGDIRGGLQTAATQDGKTGTFSAWGNVQSLTVGGDLIAGNYGSGNKLAYNGAIAVDGNIGSLAIGGSISGSPSTNAIVIAGGSAPSTPGNFNAIGKINVGGSVSYAYLAAGHQTNFTFADRIGAAENPDAGIGKVTVRGDWFHSNLTAGINDANSTGFSTGDTHSAGDPARQAILGPVVIKGHILDNPALPGFSGFGAEKIASIIAGGVKLFQSGDPGRSLDAAGFVDIAEKP